MSSSPHIETSNAIRERLTARGYTIYGSYAEKVIFMVHQSRSHEDDPAVVMLPLETATPDVIERCWRQSEVREIAGDLLPPTDDIQ